MPFPPASSVMWPSPLSPESRAHRFHSAAVTITPATLDLVTAGHALVAALGDHLVALGSYVALPDAPQAELALTVADAEQRRGIGTALGASLNNHGGQAIDATGSRAMRSWLAAWPCTSLHTDAVFGAPPSTR